MSIGIQFLGGKIFFLINHYDSSGWPWGHQSLSENISFLRLCVYEKAHNFQLRNP